MADVLRIFVVGCPRSGTTLTQAMLAAHPVLTGFTESHVFDKAYDYSGRANEAELRRRVTAFCEENKIRFHESGGFITLLDAAAKDRGARGWVEKTPDHVFRIPVIQQQAHGAKFIHVVRRAEGVLPSLRKASQTGGWDDAKPWWECAVHWLWALRISERYVDQPNHAIVGYEQLVADPRKQMARLLEFLGLPWDDAVVNDYAEQAAHLVSPGEEWKANVTGSIEAKSERSVKDLPWIGRRAAAWSKRYRGLQPYLA